MSPMIMRTRASAMQSAVFINGLVVINGTLLSAATEVRLYVVGVGCNMVALGMNERGYQMA